MFINDTNILRVMEVAENPPKKGQVKRYNAALACVHIAADGVVTATDSVVLVRAIPAERIVDPGFPKAGVLVAKKDAATILRVCKGQHVDISVDAEKRLLCVEGYRVFVPCIIVKDYAEDDASIDASEKHNVYMWQNTILKNWKKYFEIDKDKVVSDARACAGFNTRVLGNLLSVFQAVGCDTVAAFSGIEATLFVSKNPDYDGATVEAVMMQTNPGVTFGDYSPLSDTPEFLAKVWRDNFPANAAGEATADDAVESTANDAGELTANAS
jgi:hypothetical protein